MLSVKAGSFVILSDIQAKAAGMNLIPFDGDMPVMELEITPVTEPEPVVTEPEPVTKPAATKKTTSK